MEFGFDEDGYIEAVLKVPVISRDRLELVLQYLSYLAELLGEFGLRHLKQLEAENALRISERKYRNIFENAVEGIFQADHNKKYLSVNPALAQMHGYTSSEEILNNIPSMEDHLFSRPEDRSRFFDLLDRYGLVKAFETQSKTKEGKKIWVSVSARLLRNDNPFVLYEGTVENITERKEAEYKMLVAQSRLETLSKGLLKKMEIERHHIASELHDEIGQTLTFLKMKLESIRLKLEQTELGDESRRKYKDCGQDL
jgi:PAS domain S-box-containing protein